MITGVKITLPETLKGECVLKRDYVLKVIHFMS